jgi:uncharacterized protein
LGDFVKESMKPFGYSVVLCRNCNRYYGPRLVSENDFPPPLDEANLRDGTNVRVNARVDFGVTSSAMLYNAWHTTPGNTKTYNNLRLIARIEDPFYFLVAARKESGITDFSQIKQKKLPVRILSTDAATSAILDYYGITPDDIKAWGGKMMVPLDEALLGNFDIIVGFLASPSLNPESAYWTTLSEKFDLFFMELPEDLLDLIAKQNVDSEHVIAHNCLLRGIDRQIQTLGRSGESIFAREDTPDQAAYDLAKSVYENRGALKWFIRVYSYDSNTVWQNFGVPLHPGAEKFYREVKFIKD